MKVARIVYSIFLNDDKKMIVGGAENYLRNLGIILGEIDYEVYLYQYAKEYYCVNIDGINVLGVPHANSPKDIVKYIEENDHDYENDLLIFGTDYYITKNKFKKSIAIQHGVAWDITSDKNVSVFSNIKCIFRGAIRSIYKYNKYLKCKNMVCVDYNFINWYRTQVAHVDMNCFCIPNFAQIAENKECYNNPPSLIFARRFVEYRGTKLFTKALLQVLKKHSDINVTIAGTGPDENWMREQLKAYKNVTFTTFGATESLEIHSKHDIAVVPTTGSEGTSLSLLEAMSAGCAVIATNVGGMTNIVLDGYNGLLISPTERDLEMAINRLIEDFDLRRKLSRLAQETVRESFSFIKWKKSWYECIEKIEE